LFVESISIPKREQEAIGLFVILFLLINLIFFKNIYLEQGLAAIWQNLPLEVYGDLFQDFNLFETISIIGFVPLILGIMGFVLYKTRDKTITLFSAVLFAAFTLLLLRLIPFAEGVLFLAIILIIVAAISVERFLSYLELTKLVKYTTYIVFFLFIVALVSLVFPSTNIAFDTVTDGVSAEEIEALEWIRDNTSVNSIILGNVYEGNLIISIAERTNVIDTQFFYAESRIGDVDTVYTTESLIKATKALNKYDTDYIYFSEKTKELYDVESLVYTNGESCFEEVFANEAAVVYKVVC